MEGPLRGLHRAAAEEDEMVGSLPQCTFSVPPRSPPPHVRTVVLPQAKGENLHLLLPLDMPLGETPTAAEALAAPAVQLFMQRSAASGYAAELSDAEAPMVARIRRQLDGIALAIELVASRTGTFGIGGTAELVERGVDQHMAGWRSALPRHRTLHSMLDWSFRLLSNEERKILARLSVFAGPFTLEAARAVVEDDDRPAPTMADLLAGLVDKSLVWLAARGRPAVFRLLDTTRAFAAAKLAERGETELIARRHALHFIGFLEAEADAGAFDGRSGPAHAPHMGNVRKALAWSFSGAGDRLIGVDLAARAVPMFLEFSLLAEARQWCERALAVLGEPDRGTARELELQAALAMSSMYAVGKMDEVEAAIGRGLALSDTLRDDRRRLRLLTELNVLHTRRGDFKGALAVAEQHAAVAEAIGGTAEKVSAHWMLGTAFHLVGDHASGLRHCELGFELAQSVPDARFNLFHETRTRFTYARALWICGFPDRGCAVALKTIEEPAHYSDHLTRCAALVHSAPVLLWSGDYARAAEATELAIKLSDAFSLPTFRILARATWGEIEVKSGDVAAGVETLRAALSEMFADQWRMPTFRALSEGLVRLRRPNEALAVIRAAIVRAEEVGERLWLPELLRTQGEVLLALPTPDPPAAERSLVRAIELARTQSALGWELRATLTLAHIWARTGRRDEARVMLETTCRQFSEGFATADFAAAQKFCEELA